MSVRHCCLALAWLGALPMLVMGRAWWLVLLWSTPLLFDLVLTAIEHMRDLVAERRRQLDFPHVRVHRCALSHYDRPDDRAVAPARGVRAGQRGAR